MQRKCPAVIHMRVQIKGPLHGKSHGFENSGKGSRKGKTGNPKSAKGNQTSKKKRDKEQGRGSLFSRAKGMEVPFSSGSPFPKKNVPIVPLIKLSRKNPMKSKVLNTTAVGFRL